MSGRSDETYEHLTDEDDLEDSLYGYAKPDDETLGWSQLVAIATAKGHAPWYSMTAAGVALLVLDAVESADDQPGEAA